MVGLAASPSRMPAPVAAREPRAMRALSMSALSVRSFNRENASLRGPFRLRPRLRRLGDHRAGNAGDAPHAEYAVGFRVGDDLHEAVRLVIGLGPAVRQHREFADLDLAPFLRGFLGQA